MSIQTPVLTAIAQPRSLIGAPYILTLGNAGGAAVLYSLTLEPFFSVMSLALIQGVLMICTYRDPYFYQAWFARLSRKRTKTLTPIKGNRYSAF